MNTVKVGSVLSGVGLLCLAVYQFISGDYPSGLTSILAALSAFGITWLKHDNEVLKVKLQQGLKHNAHPYPYREA